jgi:hypothetical protein
METLIQSRCFADNISKKEPTDNKPEVLLLWANLLVLGAVVQKCLLTLLGEYQELGNS